MYGGARRPILRNPFRYGEEVDSATEIRPGSALVTVLAYADHPQWQGWSVESDGQTPWEGAQVAAFEVLNEIC